MSVNYLIEDLEKIRDYYRLKYKELLNQKNRRKLVKLVELYPKTAVITETVPRKLLKEHVQLRHHPITFKKSTFQLLAEFEYSLKRRGIFVNRDQLQELFEKDLKEKNKETKSDSTDSPKIQPPDEGKPTLTYKRTIKKIIKKHNIIEETRYKTDQQINEYIQDSINEVYKVCPQAKMVDLTSLKIDLGESHTLGDQNATDTSTQVYQIQNKIKLMINKKVRKYADKSMRLLDSTEFEINKNIKSLAIQDICEATFDTKVEERYNSINTEELFSSAASDFHDTNLTLSESSRSLDEFNQKEISDLSKIVDWDELTKEGKVMKLKSLPAEKTTWTNYKVDEE